MKAASDTSTLAKVAAGAVAGALGVFVLDRLDWFLFRRMSEKNRERTHAARPNGEPPAEALVTRLSEAAGRPLSPKTHRAASVATHYAIGIAPAIGYALMRDRLPGKGGTRGGAYGLAMFALQDEGLNTVSGLGGKPSAYPWQDHARGLAAHLAYGVVTEAALNRFEDGARGRKTQRTAQPALA